MMRIRDKKFYLPLIFGIALNLLMVLYWFFMFRTCNDDLGCLVFLIIPLLPGFMLHLKGSLSIIVSFIVWFLLGSLIGFLVYKLRKK